MTTLHIITGLPGSGKTTAAKRIAASNDKTVAIAADDFMVDPMGRYTFDPEWLTECHHACRVATGLLLSQGFNVVVHNTSTTTWEVEQYVAIGRREGADVRVEHLYDAGMTDEQLAARCVHGVPVTTIAKMRARYAHRVGLETK